MTNLFKEFDTCNICNAYKSEELLDETTEGKNIVNHLMVNHNGKNKINYVKDAFVLSKRGPMRNMLCELYDKTARFLDHDFMKHFTHELPQRCWEMQVCSYLLDQNNTIHVQNGSGGPDFTTEDTYYECICTEEGAQGNRIPLLKVAGNPSDINMVEVNKPSVELRISSAFVMKANKFKKYSKEKWFDHTKKCCIAINYSSNGHTFSHGKIDIGNIFLNQKKAVVNKNNTTICMGYLADSNCFIDSVILSANSTYFIHGTDSFVKIEK